MSRLVLCATFTASLFWGCDAGVHIVAENRDSGAGFDARASTLRTDLCGNGIDDDGNGRIDDGCPCGPGETQSCFPSAVTHRRIGSCTDGIQVCRASGGIEWGDWGDSPCEGAVVPAAESCDGRDRDCDGVLDNGCPCVVDETRECGLEFLRAPCTGGMQTCTNGIWSGCEGAIAPSSEVCDDGIDNDCDGEIDPGCECVPTPEICRDGIDNDCDGEIDEIACSPDWADGGEIVDIEGNLRQFCARYADGRVYCWGSNAFGGLGIGEMSLEYSATPVRPIDGARLLAMGSEAAVCVAREEGIRCWGRKTWASRGAFGYTNVEWSPFAPPEAAGVDSRDVAELAVGLDYYMFRRHDGTIWGWGYDVSGALGDGPSSSTPSSLVQVSGIDDAIDLDTLSRTVCAVRRGGSVWCWGECQRLSCSSSDDVYAPVRVDGIDDAIHVQVGRYTGCALRANGEVLCWGVDGTRGDGMAYGGGYAATPTLVPGLTQVERLEVGETAACAIRRGGELWCWGALVGGGSVPEYLMPRQIPGLGEVRDVALGNLPVGRSREDSGFGAICVLEQENRVRCWGYNGFGQNGDGTTTPSMTPVDVIGLP